MNTRIINNTKEYLLLMLYVDKIGLLEDILQRNNAKLLIDYWLLCE